MSASPRRQGFLRAATRIGDSLCSDAYWYGNACNWLGHPASEVSDLTLPATPTVAALTADVYGGSAGVALFLAQLHRATGAARFGETAIGAITQALGRAADEDNTLPPLGFYAGRLGIAWAASRIGAWLGLPAIARQGLTLARALATHTGAAHVFDLISGTSGAILALLALSRAPDGADLLTVAQRLGDELVASAVREGEVWSWDVMRATGPGMGARMLTGLSHGAAGIGVALAALYARTGRPELRDAAVGAFAYEDRWFDEVQQNWLDLRVSERSGMPAIDRSAPSAPPKVFGMAWCHGAPGIGLGRLRAAMLIPDRAAAWRHAIDAAVRTSASWLSLHVRDRSLDATPCHGLAGVTELLFEATRQLPDLGVGTEVGHRAWRGMIGAHEESESWPSGVATRARNPSLMLGTAGVGHALLRLHDRSVESLLLISTE